MLYFNSILLWFGAAISIAEIFTGTLFAPLGLKLGITIIVIGHLIGCSLMYLVGLISTKTGLSTMEGTERSFGKIGKSFFASLNGLQLIGWSAVMIFSGANASHILIPSISITVWSIIISSLIVLWLIVKFKELKTFSFVVILLLFILTIIVSKQVFTNKINSSTNPQSLSIFSALELSIAMPLSWLPLIGDYTNDTKNTKVPLVSSITYFFASSWMYIVGLACALFAKESDFAQILLKANMGTVGILIIVLSTVTTTFLDAFSCGISFSALKFNSKKISIICVILGLIISIYWNQGSLEAFLYLISSVFVPMAAIQITDYFLLKKDISHLKLNVSNSIIFIIGFILYRVLLATNFFLGISIPVIFTTSLLVIIYNFLISKRKKND